MMTLKGLNSGKLLFASIKEPGRGGVAETLHILTSRGGCATVWGGAGFSLDFGGGRMEPGLGPLRFCRRQRVMSGGDAEGDSREWGVKRPIRETCTLASSDRSKHLQTLYTRKHNILTINHRPKRQRLERRTTVRKCESLTYLISDFTLPIFYGILVLILHSVRLFTLAQFAQRYFQPSA